MRLPVVIYYNGYLLALNGFFMLVSAFVGWLYGDNSGSILYIPGLISIVLGFLPIVLLERKTDVSLKESILLVTGGWLSCSITGAVPFYLYGAPFTIVNSLFESVSGYTTTGATILTSVENLPRGLLFWRAITQWLGGIGIIAFALAVMPRMGQVGKLFLQKEYTGMVSQAGQSRAVDVARGLLIIYICLTIGQTVALVLSGLPLFDSLSTALTTVPTGGFSVRNFSIASYDNPIAEVIIMLFMLIAGVNFLYLHLLIIQPKSAKTGLEVLITYIGTLLIVTVLVTIFLWSHYYGSFWASLRYASFQIVSLGTSTGYGTADSAVWPMSARMGIIVVTLIGACSGSTGGGLKIDRLLLFFKLLRFRFKQLIHPSIVPSIRVDGLYVNLESVERMVFYILPYLGILGIGTWLLNIIGMGSVEAFTGCAACVSNAGPGMGTIGSMGNYSAVPELGKIILAIIMLAGRLEIYVVALPFLPGFWKK